MRILAFDPSIRALGYAVFSVQEGLGDSGVYRIGTQEDWYDGLDAMVSGVIDDFGGGDWDRVLIEQPQHLVSSRGSAAANSGALVKLVSVAASLRWAFIEREFVVEMVPLSWKGQVPKGVTMQRMRRRWGWDGTDHNECDAVGIGSWYLRKSKRIADGAKKRRVR